MTKSYHFGSKRKTKILKRHDKRRVFNKWSDVTLNSNKKTNIDCNIHNMYLCNLPKVWWDQVSDSWDLMFIQCMDVCFLYSVNSERQYHMK